MTALPPSNGLHLGWAQGRSSFPHAHACCHSSHAHTTVEWQPRLTGNKRTSKDDGWSSGHRTGDVTLIGHIFSPFKHRSASSDWQPGPNTIRASADTGNMSVIVFTLAFSHKAQTQLARLSDRKRLARLASHYLLVLTCFTLLNRQFMPEELICIPQTYCKRVTFLF